MTAWLWSDLQHGARALRRTPGFAAVAILTMGLGIGANTAVFSVLYTVMLDPLPYDEPEALVWLQNRYLPEGDLGGISEAEFAEFRQETGAFEDISAISTVSSNLTGLGGPPLRLQGMRVSPRYFAMLRVTPALGPAFGPLDKEPGAEPGVVLSDGLWRRAFGADPAVVGSTIRLDGASVTVRGVMPSGFRAPGAYLFPGRRVEFWAPVVMDPTTYQERVNFHGLYVMGRLSQGDTPESAEVSLKAAVRRLEERYADLSGAGSRDVRVTPLRERVVGDVAGTLLILAGASGLVLLMACLNLANLLMARAESRRAEVAVRAALGAGRGRQISHAVSESVLIGLAGGLLGLGLTVVARGFLTGLVPSATALPSGLTMGLPLVGFAIALSASAGVLTGALPALRAARRGIFAVLRAGSERGALGVGHSTGRRALVVAQIAGAVVLVSAAGLLLRTLAELQSVDPGFTAEGLLMVQINATRRDYPDPPSVARLYSQIESEVGALPGVAAVAASWQTPMQTAMSDWPVQAEGVDDQEWKDADPNLVSPAYFGTLGLKLLAGRTFEAADAERAIPPVVLSRTAARVLWGDEDLSRVIGRRVNLDFRTPTWREVVGIVDDARLRGLTATPRAQTYMSFGPGPFGSIPDLTLSVRTTIAPGALRTEVSRMLAAIDPNVPLGPVLTMDDQMAATIEREQLLSATLALLSLLALSLGSIGIYGLLAFAVHTRRREIGLRMAMGAQPHGVLRLVVLQGLRLAVIGLGLGVIGALAAGRLLEGILFGVSGTDPATFALVSAVVLGVTVFASFVPARRAAAVDPLRALSS